LPEFFAQGLRDKPRRDVGDAAGAERQDHAHRMIRIFGLSMDGGRGEADGNQRQRENGSPPRYPEWRLRHAANPFLNVLFGEATV
jgi:hypothetical protein